MNTVNASHFARMCQVSRESVSKAIKTDRIKTIGEGRSRVVDLDHRVTQEYLRTKNPNYKAGVPTEPPKKKTPPKPKPKTKVNPKINTPKPEPLEITAIEVSDDTPPDAMVRSLDDVDGNNLAFVDKTDLQKFKIYEDALKVRQDRESKRGELIPRIMVRQVISKLYSIHVNEFKTMEDRLTPDICSIFGVQDSSPEAVKIRQLLNTDSGKTLKSIQRLFNDFLAKIKAKTL
jgi:hypothetical protein